MVMLSIGTGEVIAVRGTKREPTRTTSPSCSTVTDMVTLTTDLPATFTL